jgi:ankyrin repeat protein
MSLLAKGADVNARFPNGKTVLMMAADNCNRSVVQAILDRGADITAKDSDGATALVYAENGREGLPKEEVLSLLRAALANQERPDGASHQALSAGAGAKLEHKHKRSPLARLRALFGFSDHVKT